MSRESKILLIEDDSDELDALRTILEANRYVVLTASDGRRGLELAESEHPDLVIVDLMMPPPDGFTVCDRLRHAPEGYRPAVMVVTALDEKMHMGRDSADVRLRVDVDDYVEKPFELDDFLDRVNALVSRRRSTGFEENRK